MVVSAPEWNHGEPVRIAQVHRVHGGRIAVRYQDAYCRRAGPRRGGVDRDGADARVRRVRQEARVTRPAEQSPTASGVLRRAADYIETHQLDRFNVTHVIRAAAAELTPFGPDAYEQADAALRALAAHLGYRIDRDPVRDLTRWSRIRATEWIVIELRRAGAR
ncbi:hypothetical protein GCM10010176_034980 [Nonomuraea spiralis]|nr:hypothetical protein GCM10010176_034980 [Nonomuraea spiralis]